MYWLCKIIQSQMTGEDINSHLDTLGGYAEKLNALVTTKNPLTVDDVHSTAISISLPSDWLNCVLAMINKEQVPLSRVIAALKAESLRRKSCGDQVEPIIVASAEVVAAGVKVDKSKLNCSFCKLNGHDLLKCSKASRILKEHKTQRHQEFLDKQGAESTSRPAKPNRKKSLARAAHASVVELDYFSGEEGKSGSNDLEYKISRAAVTPLFSQISEVKPSDFNLDLGCSVLMSPYLNSVNNPKLDIVPVC
jgi:hypothetical protein